MERKERYDIESNATKYKPNIKKDKEYLKIIIVILFVLLMLFIVGLFIIINVKQYKKNSIETSIIYGEIDETIEYMDVSKPKEYNNNGNFYGNNYFNLYQNCSSELGILNSSGNFTYDNDFFYYSLYVDEQYLVVKQNIETNDKKIIYTGNEINNLLNINGWIYGIQRNIYGDSIIYFDINGNSIKTKDFNNHIASLISDGESLYYTSDAMPYIYKIDLLLNNIEIVTSCDRFIAYPEILNIEDYIIYYTDFNGLYSYDIKNKSKQTLTTSIVKRYNKPYFSDKNIFFIDNNNNLHINNMKYDIQVSALSIIDETILVAEKKSLYSIDINEYLVYNIIENEFNINSIYVTNNSIIISDGIKYKKIERN